MINDEAHTCYLFDYDNTTQTFYQTPTFIGSYDFSLSKSGNDYLPYLTLSYVSDKDGMPTNGDLPPTDYKFSLLGSSTTLYTAINYYLGVDWTGMKESLNTQSKSNMPISPTSIIMMEMGRNYTAYGSLIQETIPENILK